MASSYQHKRGTKAQITAAASSNQLRVGEVYLMMDEQRLVVATAADAFQSLFGGCLSGFLSGKSAASEIVSGAIFPIPSQIVASLCAASSVTAAAATTVFTIKNKTSGQTVGTFTFAAGATLATVSITNANVSAGAMLYIEAPATPDTALANVAFIVRA